VQAARSARLNKCLHKISIRPFDPPIPREIASRGGTRSGAQQQTASCRCRGFACLPSLSLLRSVRSTLMPAGPRPRLSALATTERAPLPGWHRRAGWADDCCTLPMQLCHHAALAVFSRHTGNAPGLPSTRLLVFVAWLTDSRYWTALPALAAQAVAGSSIAVGNLGADRHYAVSTQY
jgi:hypothetical protein